MPPLIRASPPPSLQVILTLHPKLPCIKKCQSGLSPVHPAVWVLRTTTTMPSSACPNPLTRPNRIETSQKSSDKSDRPSMLTLGSPLTLVLDSNVAGNEITIMLDDHYMTWLTSAHPHCLISPRPSPPKAVIVHTTNIAHDDSYDCFPLQTQLCKKYYRPVSSFEKNRIKFISIPLNERILFSQ